MGEDYGFLMGKPSPSPAGHLRIVAQLARLVCYRHAFRGSLLDLGEQRLDGGGSLLHRRSREMIEVAMGEGVQQHQLLREAQRSAGRVRAQGRLDSHGSRALRGGGGVVGEHISRLRQLEA